MKAGTVPAKPVIWSFDRVTEIAAVDRNTQRDDYRRICYAVVDAVLSIRETGQVKAEHLQAFADAVQSGNEYVATHGGRRLMECCSFNEEARAFALGLLAHKKWRVRFNMVWLMGYSGDSELILAGFSRALNDKSKQVRLKVLDEIVCHCLKIMLPGLKRKLVEETDDEFRQEIANTMAFVRGKVVDLGDAGRWRLVKHGKGWALQTVQ